MYGSHRQSGMPLVPRARTVLLIGIVGLAALTFGLLQTQSDAIAKPKEKVTVCHATGSATNPVLLLNVNEHAVQHHLDHGDYLPDAPGTCERITTTRDPDPGPTPNNPTETVVVTQTSGVTATGQSKQAARVCTSRRSFRIRVRSKRRDPVVRATVSVNGKRVKTLKGKRITAPVVLRGLPKGTFLVKITATTRKGRKISGTRKYRTCTPKGARQTIPLL